MIFIDWYDKRRALAQVNRIRARYGHPKLRKLEKGHIGLAHSCPIQRSIPNAWSVNSERIRTNERDFSTFAATRRFIVKFDSGHYPRLEM